MDNLRVGLIARADNRGLGNQTWDLFRHLAPARTAVVDMAWNSPYEQHLERYPDALLSPPGELADRLQADGWFAGAVDVILTAETPYDYRIYDLARAAGVATVCQVNPEFWPYGRDPSLPRPTLAVSPTSWLNSRMPGVEVLAHPVDRDVLPYQPRGAGEPLTFLHVAGHKAMLDRNGTGTVLQALSMIRQPCRFVIRSQSPVAGASGRAGRHVEVVQHHGDLEHPSELYAEADVLVLPRRYGGQSLPMNEAAACGLALLVSDLPPQNEFVPPAGRVPAARRRRFMTQGGAVDAWQVDPRRLAQKVDELVLDRGLAAGLSDASHRYANLISWERLLPKWTALLRRAVEMTTSKPTNMRSER